MRTSSRPGSNEQRGAPAHQRSHSHVNQDHLDQSGPRRRGGGLRPLRGLRPGIRQGPGHTILQRLRTPAIRRGLHPHGHATRRSQERRTRRGASVVPYPAAARHHRHGGMGAELRAPSWQTWGTLDFTPFLGLGGGGRTYNYRDLDADAKSNVAGYGVVGGELGFGRFGLRLEARDYVSRFKPFDGSDSETRNDVTITSG